MASTVVILGTGGTIAGVAADAADNIGYASAQRRLVDMLADLVACVPALAGPAIEAEQVAQLDSKDMGPAIWQSLARRVAHHLARPEIAGLVITHGTDTLEETAWLLQRVLAPAKPVVLVAAMRPATGLSADGPQNLLDALTVARTPGARGVRLVTCARSTPTGSTPSSRVMLARWGWSRPAGCGAFANGRQATHWVWVCWTPTRRAGPGSRSSRATRVRATMLCVRCALPGCRVWW